MREGTRSSATASCFNIKTPQLDPSTVTYLPHPCFHSPTTTLILRQSLIFKVQAPDHSGILCQTTPLERSPNKTSNSKRLPGSSRVNLGTILEASVVLFGHRSFKSSINQHQATRQSYTNAIKRPSSSLTSQDGRQHASFVSEPLLGPSRPDRNRLREPEHR